MTAMCMRKSFKSVSQLNLPKFMCFAIEGPELSSIDFNEILDVLKENNRRILL